MNGPAKPEQVCANLPALEGVQVCAPADRKAGLGLGCSGGAQTAPRFQGSTRIPTLPAKHTHTHTSRGAHADPHFQGSTRGPTLPGQHTHTQTSR
eukprot:363073-Chlamydomonas_euryale.AAC.15